MGSTNRLSLTPCGKKNARPDIDEQPFGIFKTLFSYFFYWLYLSQPQDYITINLRRVKQLGLYHFSHNPFSGKSFRKFK
jgi:hypothetical protein